MKIDCSDCNEFPYQVRRAACTDHRGREYPAVINHYRRFTDAVEFACRGGYAIYNYNTDNVGPADAVVINRRTGYVDAAVRDGSLNYPEVFGGAGRYVLTGSRMYEGHAQLVDWFDSIEDADDYVAADYADGDGDYEWYSLVDSHSKAVIRSYDGDDGLVTGVDCVNGRDSID